MTTRAVSTRTGILTIVLAAAAAIAIAAWFGRTGTPLPEAGPGATPHAAADGAQVSAFDTERQLVEAGAPTTAAAARPGTIAVRVLLRDGTPAVGALVRMSPPEPVATRRPFDGEADWQSFGTDSEAVAQLPWPRRELGQVRITARHGTQWGSLQLSSSAPLGAEHLLHLSADQALVVRAVDRDGTPVAGAAVELLATTIDLDDDSQTTLAAEHTDATGTAVFTHAQRWRDLICPHDGTRPLRVAAGQLGRATPIDLDANALPDAPVVLRFEEFGAIEIEPLAADGSLLVNEHVAVGSGNQVWVAMTNGTVLRCPVAPVGQRYRVTLLFSSTVEVDGPARAGDVVRVTLRAGPFLTVSGRLLHDAAPFAQRLVALFHDGASGLLDVTETDADGRFRFHLPAGQGPFGDEPEPALFVRTCDRVGRPTDLAAPWRGRSADQGTLDLGTLSLRRDALPVLVAGRIVAPGPLDGTTVAVGQVSNDRFVELESTAHTMVHADGAFEVRGATDATDLHLLVGSPAHLGIDPVPFRPGQRDLVVTLRAELERTATFLLPSRELAVAVRAVVRIPSDESDDDPYDFEPDSRHWDGQRLHCRWRQPFEGRYDILVLDHRGAPLHTIPAVWFAAAAGPDPRLVDVRLPVLRPVRITVPTAVPARGLDSMSTQLTLLDGDATERSIPAVDACTFLVLAEPPVDLHVQVPGYRNRVLRGVRVDTTVALEPAIAVALRTTFDRAHAGQVVLYLAGADAVGSVTLRSDLTTVYLPAAGRYTLDCGLLAPDLSLGKMLCEPTEIDVGEDGGTFVIRVYR
ncbi:MAG: hypothetical protein JNL08_09510 [Planctomycetes bacterium]|nr:hypothetical protein [Planctomycetota bacterium]